MKNNKSLKVIVALLLSASILGLAACSKEDDNKVDNENDTVNADTTGNETEPETDPETNPPVDEETQPETDPETEKETEPVVPVLPETSTTYLIEQMSTYHYTTFVCPYTDGEGNIGGGAAGGFFDPETDEMAKFVAENPEWYKDTELMAKWEEADSPFGDCIEESIAAGTDFIYDKVNTNGLMVYKTFNVDKVDDTTYFTLNCFYDNTVYIYINGELYYYADANCGNGDWNGGYDTIPYNATAEEKTLRDFMKEGENYIAISIKNCWGGRELDLELSVEENATKDTITFFPIKSEWNYKVFSCPYTDGEGNIDGGAAGGFFDPETDEMAKFIAENPNFMTDTALLSTWDTAAGPFGQAAESIGWTGGNHGLILYKSFNVADLEKAKACDYFKWNCSYDNAIHVYLNGTEVFTHDGACVEQDWNGGYTDYTTNDGSLGNVGDVLVEGENYFVVTIKDAWGGRDFDAGFSAEWN